ACLRVEPGAIQLAACAKRVERGPVPCPSRADELRFDGVFADCCTPGQQEFCNPAQANSAAMVWTLVYQPDGSATAPKIEDTKTRDPRSPQERRRGPAGIYRCA